MSRIAALILASLLSLVAAMAQAQGIIITVAGGGPNNMPALDANLNLPAGVAVDSAGNRYIAAQYQNRIFKVSAAGHLTVFAGNGTPGFSGDGGLATVATVSFPQAVALDSGNNLYIVDYGNSRIRRVDATTGIITTVAGNGNFGFSGDGGLATAAGLGYPTGVALDGGGNLYIVESGSYRVRRVDAATGIITTVAGNGIYGFSGDGGPATAASLNFPRGVAVDSAGNLYIADAGNYRIRQVNAATGVITTVAGNGSPGFSGDGGLATSASLNFPWSVALDSSGNLYIVDTSNYRIRRVGTGGIISTVAGNGTRGFSGDGGPATAASLNEFYGVAVGNGGNLYVADTYNNRIRQVDAASGVISTVAGNGTRGFSGDGGPATDASISPSGVAPDSRGNLSIADGINSRVRRVTASTGVITTVAGNGTQGFSGDGGLATVASLAYAVGVAFDGSGNGYIADFYNNRIRRVDAATGVITTVAGNGTEGFGGDGGPATAASLYHPTSVTVDDSGNLYIVDTYNNRIRQVAATTGVITTVAGNGTQSFGGDGELATAASLYHPSQAAFDRGGNLYIADTVHGCIRRVDAATGVITTVAGVGSDGEDGQHGYSGDGGPATAAQMYYPGGVALDSGGNIYIADTSNNRIRRVDVVTGIITTVIGNGIYGFSGDGGVVTAASLARPGKLAFDRSGQLYIADGDNLRVRLALLTPAAAINYLAVRIADSSLPLVIKTGMTARLSTAKDKVNDSNPNNDTAACGIVTSIVNELTAMQNSGRLSAGEADTLRQSADAASLAIGCR